LPVPSNRGLSTLVYDSKRGLSVMFGGVANAGSVGDTWEWDGTNWTNPLPLRSPSARSRHGLAFASTRGVVVLFGGVNSLGVLGDTWEWDGVNWSEKNPMTAVPVRFDLSMTYDPVRQRTIVFGGINQDGYLSDTWEWDGTDWRVVSANQAANAPTPRTDAGFVFDSKRQQAVLFGGSSPAAFHNDTWLWNGLAWKQIEPSIVPPPMQRVAVAYAPNRGGLMTFGGADRNGVAGSSWLLKTESASSAYETCLSSTDDLDGDGLTSCLDPDCNYRCAPLCLPLLPCDAALPRCGDGICNQALEDNALCPVDCS
jgi:hypothetical protein